MKELVDEVIEVPYDELESFEFPVGYPFGVITYFNNVKYEFLVHLKEDSERIIFCGSGALNPNRDNDRSRPHLNRWSWSHKFSESIIYYNDPTLYIHDDIWSGYGIGTIDDYYLENMANMFLMFAKNLGCSNKNMLFYGSSAGGFTSLMLSILVKESSCVCDIPQFYVNKLWSKYWPDLKRRVFIGMDEDEILSKYGYRINVIEMMKKEKYIPNAILILDCTVDRDYDSQYVHFFEDLRTLPFEGNLNNLKLIINGKFEGHAPIGMYETLSIVKNSKYILNMNDHKFLTNNEYSEYLELKKFKEKFLGIFGSISLDELDINLDSKYEKMYQDIMNRRNLSDYNVNVRSYHKVKNSEFFDPDYYINEYDINISKKYALLHYLNEGFKEGKNPSEKFLGDEYLEVNWDVKRHGMNPLVHYELYGKKEGRVVPFFKI